MKNFVSVILFILFLSPWLIALEPSELKGQRVKNWPFYVYSDSFNKANHYFPSGWMGDVGDMKITDKWAGDPKTGKTCLQIKYTAEKKQNNGWAGIYWQNPANNWGNQKGGFDLTGAKKLDFYARGEKGGETVEFKCGGISGEYSDSFVATSNPLTLTKDWRLYSIDLDKTDLSYVNGGFSVIFSSDDNPDGLTVYIDEIVYTTGGGAAALK